MKRSILCLGAAAALAIPAAAGASESPAQCSAHGQVWSTPGKMFQAARADLGVNPAELAGAHSIAIGQRVTVGQLVQLGCNS